jgi:hypothetical protein
MDGYNFNSWWVWLVALIITLVAAYFAFIIILYWLKPAFYTVSGEPEWGNSAWVVLLTYGFTWLLLLVIFWIVKMATGNKNRKVADGCTKPQCDL